MGEVIELSNELDQEVRAGELAEILGLSPTRIRELALEGVVIRVRRGWYAFVPSVRVYIDYWKQRTDRNQKCSDDHIEKLRALDFRRKTAETIAAELALQEKLENLTPTSLIRRWLERGAGAGEVGDSVGTRQDAIATRA